MKKRQVKKTVVRYEEKQQKNVGRQEERDQRSRSRDKIVQPNTHKANPIKVQQTNVNSRRARLQAMKRAQQKEELDQEKPLNVDIVVKMENQKPILNQQMQVQKQQQPQRQTEVVQVKKQATIRRKKSQQSQSEESSQEEGAKVVRKPIFISRQYRDTNKNEQEQQRQQQRKRKYVKYTTKLLLQQQKYGDSQQQNEQTDSDNQNNYNGVNDDDTIDQQLEFQKWKHRQLTRIRRAWQERRKHDMQKAQLDRRRSMTNQAILIQNKALGSDATQNQTQTKYAFMQKFYHKGAFYQDSQDQVFKRDYNLPTPMEMQDKTLLPKILQKRMGNFGKKGQSKYTHLTAQDTSDLNPLTRADQSLLDYWKKRTAGYKGAHSKNI